MRGLLLIAPLLAAGCGDDGSAPDTCTIEGSGVSDGLIRGAPLGPFVRAGQFLVDDRWALVLDETAAACGVSAPTGRQLVLLSCEPLEERNYRIVTRQLFACPGNEVLGIVEQGGATDVAVSTQGVLRIDHVGSCVTGGFDVQFGSEGIVGTFDAIVCAEN